MSITREEIRQLCIAHDRFMAEQASESITRPPPVSEIETDGLIFKDYDNSALQPAYEPEPEEGFNRSARCSRCSGRNRKIVRPY